VFKIGLIGAGGMAGTHARAYANLPNATLVGVTAAHPETAQALAAAHGARVYDSLETLWEAERPDIIDVCSPTPFHEEYVLRAAELGPRGVIVEKPMARTVDGCRRMMAACERAGVPLFVAHVLRFFPEFAAAKEQVDAGAVGTPAAIRTRRGGPYPRGIDDWFGNVTWSGGVILDLMIHDLDWLRWTFGEVERVFAKSIAAGDGTVDKDFALVTLRFRSGAMAHVEGTWADPGGFKVGFEIAGDSGLLEYNFNQPSGVAFTSVSTVEEGARAGVVIPENPTGRNPYQEEIAHFLRCLETGEQPIITPRDGLEAVRICEAAIESARTGRVVSLAREEAGVR
jgi:predicted dehydrogenase